MRMRGEQQPSLVLGAEGEGDLVGPGRLAAVPVLPALLGLAAVVLLPLEGHPLAKQTPLTGRWSSSLSVE